ncbi:hypothetical protein [Armatimonas rosea]|uniref:Peptidase C-terminal archaeal/bacterial domain-containing protein n=1 Tax=Armatimonas rosea TaxID=685828 RepID=A0A7W9W640_ARMRO|nr:hypothetical protein [Armatimonas rosea]MBB6049187.1 hypothetical protein [Armatimonas rosea]
MQNKPTLKELTVFGLVAGQTTTLTLTGENLTPSGVTVKGPLQAKLLDTKPNTATVEVIVPAECPPESFELTLVHPKDSPTIKLPVLVAAVKEVTVKKPLSRFDQAFSLVPAPSLAVQTNLDNDQAHLYQLPLKRGEKLEITVTGARSSLSDLDPLVRLRDSQRRMLTLATGRLRVDRRLFFTAPTDGMYFLEIGDAQQRGGPRMLYRLVVRRL